MPSTNTGTSGKRPVAQGALEDQQDLLGPADGKGGDQHPAAAADHFANLPQQPLFGRVAILVQPFAVGRFADHQIGLEIRPAQGRHGLLSGDAVVAGEQDRAGRRLQQDHRRTQDVRRRQPADLDLADLDRLVVLDRRHRPQQLLHLALGVQRHLRFAVGTVHQPQRVAQQDAHQIDRRRRGEHRRGRTGFDQARAGRRNGPCARGSPAPRPPACRPAATGRAAGSTRNIARRSPRRKLLRHADQGTRSADRAGASQERDFDGVWIGHGILDSCRRCDWSEIRREWFLSYEKTRRWLCRSVVGPHFQTQRGDCQASLDR